MKAVGIPLGRRALRPLLVAVTAFVVVALLPHSIAPSAQPAITQLHGQQSDGAVTYDNIPVADVLDDVARLTGFRAVAFPGVAGRRFTGSLALDPDGSRMAASLAGKLGLDLRLAGPHWALADEMR